jgi:hypothetical protein
MRRGLALLAVVLVLGGAVGALALLVRDEAEPPGLPVGDDGIAARTSLSDRSQLFGEQLVARLDLLVDRKVLDPDHVAVDARFAPFTSGGSAVVTRVDHGRFTSLRFEYRLDCLAAACVPETLTQSFALPELRVRHEGSLVEVAQWPRVTIGSRIGEPADDGNEGRFRSRSDIAWRANLDLAEPTYRVDTTLLTSLLVSGAAALLLASVLLLLHAFPVARLGLHRLRGDRTTPLERALRVLERAHAQGLEREQRLALDRLAQELRTGGQHALAGTARELAWEQRIPDSGRTAPLSERVRDVIAGSTNGRP